jgi:hypothetical protein
MKETLQKTVKVRKCQERERRAYENLVAEGIQKPGENIQLGNAQVVYEYTY